MAHWGLIMEKLKSKYKEYLYKYLGAEQFVDKNLDMDEISKSVFLVLMDFYKQAIKEMQSACDIERVEDVFYKYKQVMNETVDSYITTYCDIFSITYEKLKYNEYLINRRKEVNIDDGFTYAYNTLNKIVRRKDFRKTLIQDVKDAIKFK